jgi:ice-binding like protein
MSRVPRMLACMIEICSPLARLSRLSAIVLFAVLLYNPSPGSAQAVAPSLGSASTFALLAGTAVTCTNSTVSGDVGVWPGSAVTQVICPVVGTVHAGDGPAQQAYLDFISAYNELRDSPPPCDATLTGTLAGEVLLPGVYCVDDVAKTGTLTLDAGTSGANAVWLFLVEGWPITRSRAPTSMWS